MYLGCRFACWDISWKFYSALLVNECHLRAFQRLCWGWYPCGVMVTAMESGILVSEFVVQSRYYVHFRANTLGKVMNPLILPDMG